MAPNSVVVTVVSHRSIIVTFLSVEKCVFRTFLKFSSEHGQRGTLLVSISVTIINRKKHILGVNF